MMGGLDFSKSKLKAKWGRRPNLATEENRKEMIDA